MKVLLIAIAVLSIVGTTAVLADRYCGPKPRPTRECEDWVRIWRGTVCTWECVPREN